MIAALLSLACWYFSYQSNCWQAGNDMGQGVMDLCWACLETCLELPKCRYLVSLYSNLMDQFEGSMITSENSSATGESSLLIILKSRLNSTGHSACTSEVHDIFDCQTHVPNNSLQPWAHRNSMTAPIHNITQDVTQGQFLSEIQLSFPYLKWVV